MILELEQARRDYDCEDQQHGGHSDALEVLHPGVGDRRADHHDRAANRGDRGERRGLVCRTPDPDDGRYTLAMLTDAGLDAVVAAAHGHVETVRALVFDPLTKAKSRQLRDICLRVLSAVDPGGHCFDDQR